MAGRFRHGLIAGLIVVASACFIGAAIVDERRELAIVSMPKEIDLGIVDLEATQECKIRLQNSGRSSARIVKTGSSCGCAIAKMEERVLRPGDEANLHVSIKAGSHAGSVIRTVYVETANDRATLVELVSIPIRLTVRPKQ